MHLIIGTCSPISLIRSNWRHNMMGAVSLCECDVLDIIILGSCNPWVRDECILSNDVNVLLFLIQHTCQQVMTVNIPATTLMVLCSDDVNDCEVIIVGIWKSLVCRFIGLPCAKAMWTSSLCVWMKWGLVRPSFRRLDFYCQDKRRIFVTTMIPWTLVPTRNPSLKQWCEFFISMFVLNV